MLFFFIPETTSWYPGQGRAREISQKSAGLAPIQIQRTKKDHSGPVGCSHNTPCLVGPPLTATNPHAECTAAASEAGEEADTGVETAEAAVQVNIGGRRNRRGKSAGQKEGHDDA